MNKSGRYWVFAFNDDSKGGMNDFRFSFNNLGEFEDKVEHMIKDFKFYQVLDTQTNFHYEGDFGTFTTWVCKNIGDERHEEII